MFRRLLCIINNSHYTNVRDNDSQAEPNILKLKNKRIGMSLESTSKIKFVSSNFKLISGGDSFTCRTLFKEKYEIFKPTFKPIIQTNHFPVFDEIDNGLLSRIIVINFPYTFYDELEYDKTNIFHKKQNNELKSYLKDIKQDFFHFILKYYKIYKQEGITILPNEIKKNTNEYKKEIDTIKAFIEDFLIKTNKIEDIILTTEMNNKHNEIYNIGTNITTFVGRIKKLGLIPERKRINGKQNMCIIGYKFKENDTDVI